MKLGMDRMKGFQPIKLLSLFVYLIVYCPLLNTKDMNQQCSHVGQYQDN